MAKKAFAKWQIRSYILMDDVHRGPFSTPSTPTHKFVRWYPPNPGVVKLNFDDSSNHYSAARRFILHDWTGKVIKLGTMNYGQSSSLVAKAHA